MRFTVFIMLALMSGPLIAADQRLSEQETQQLGLRKRTGDVGEQIEAIVDEYERNGLGDGDDVRTLKAIRGVLSNLSAEEMDKVVTLLRQARVAQGDTARRDVATAYAQQKGIIAQLR